MATFTTAQMKAAGVNPAGTDAVSFPGPVVMEYILDASKKTIAAADIVTFFDIPAYTGVVITAASLAVLQAGAATSTIDIGIAGTDITGLTAFDAATVGESIKLATAANSVITTSGVSSLTAQVNTAGLSNGLFRIRVYGTLIAA
jgi:hypothetical protein